MKVLNQIEEKFTITHWAIITFLLLFAVFRFNALHTINKKWYRSFQLDSDKLVIDALIINELSPGQGFLKRIKTENHKIKERDLLAAAKISSIEDVEYENYYSQFGLGKYLLTPVWNLSLLVAGESRDRFVFAYENIKTFMSLLNAFVFTLFFLWVFREFGARTYLVFLPLSLIFSEWILVFGRSPYWQVWSWYLPMLVSFFILKNKDNQTKYILGFLFYFFAVFIKCLMGYEFLSTILIASTMPFFYYFFKGEEVKFVKNISLLIVLSFGAFLSALLIHYNALLSVGVSGMDEIINLIAKRSSLVGGEVSKEYLNSLNASVFEVLWIYLTQKIYELPLLLFLGLFIGFLLKKNKLKDPQKVIALSKTTLIMLLAPLSWFILMKGHSYIHTFINFALWYLPVNFLVFVLFASSRKS